MLPRNPTEEEVVRLVRYGAGVAAAIERIRKGIEGPSAVFPIEYRENTYMMDKPPLPTLFYVRVEAVGVWPPAPKEPTP